MNLIVFDIDGTLTQTNTIDEQCFHQALEKEFGFNSRNLSLYDFTHATDSCIFREAFQKFAKRNPLPEEIQIFQNRFLSLLQESFELDQNHFAEVAGARKTIEVFKNSPDWQVAIATGGWKCSATFKLKCIDISLEGIPAAFADDGISREEIVQTSILRAKAQKTQTFDQTVYIGDGVWDAKTCKNLGIPFFGISTRTPAKRLLQEGAVRVFPNFLLDFHQQFNCLPDQP